MKKIPISNKNMPDKYISVSDQDYNKISQHKWYAVASPNGKMRIRADMEINGSRRTVYLTRYIWYTLMDKPHGGFVNNLDGDPYNCVRDNLGIVSRKEIKINPVLDKKQYKGVETGNIWAQGMERNLKLRADW